jgi:hypothetical protein
MCRSCLVNYVIEGNKGWEYDLDGLKENKIPEIKK